MARALDGRLAETLALFRMRALRFAQDEATCALAEQLDERLACGVAPRPQTARAAERFLDELRAGPTARLDAHRLARTEGIDLDAELAARHAHARRPLRAADPRLVVLVVGAPRSGTSHLLNLLAFQQRFAYLTNVSCWAWPTYHLARTRKRPFATLGPGIFSADSKRLKLDARLVLPTEGEDVLARAIPCYERLRGHEYRLLPAHVRDPALLMGSLRAHLEHFERSAIVVKSPFNAFRIGELRALLGDAVRIVHIHRDGYAAAASIAANGFAYRWRDGSALRAEQAWSARRSTPRATAPCCASRSSDSCATRARSCASCSPGSGSTASRACRAARRPRASRRRAAAATPRWRRCIGALSVEARLDFPNDQGICPPMIRGDDLNDLYRRTVAHVLEHGREVAPRGLPTREVLGVQLRLARPRARLLEVRGRVVNPAFAVAEAVWMLAGSDAAWIYDFNEQLRRYADDGVLRGAYGPRLRRWRGGIDQLDRVRRLLIDDPSSRQATVQLFDPERDWDGARDVPCTIGHRFFVRDEALHMCTTMRSQDVWLGLPYDVFSNTVLQELMAAWLGVGVGEYVHSVDSLHLYAGDLAAAAAVGPPEAAGGDEQAALDVPFAQLDAVLAAVRDGEQPEQLAPGWRACAETLASYRAWKAGRREEALAQAASLEGPLGRALRRWYEHLRAAPAPDPGGRAASAAHG
jgi:thymidylate synthase